MKDKIKARYDAIKNDPYKHGMLVGGAIGINITVLAGLMLRVNLDDKGLYVPDHLIDSMRANGFAVAVKNGTRIILAISPEVE